MITLRNKLRVVNEPILEFSRFRSFNPVGFLSLLSELLELETLEVDLLQALHSLVIFIRTLESALRDIRETCERLYFEVATVDKLVNVFLVDLFKFFFIRTVGLRRCL